MRKDRLKRIHGSQSAFWQGAVVTSSRSGCFRNQLIDAYEINETFPKHLAELGAFNEVVHETGLKEAKIVFEREVVVKHPIEDVEGVMFSGRLDFLLYPGEHETIHELKSASSKNTYSKIFKKGEYKPENLAQLLAYMISRETEKGRLIYSFYKEIEGGWEHKEDRVFEVQISEDGKILIDSKDSGFTVMDQLQHRLKSAIVLRDGVIEERPKNWQQKWTSPCTWCVFQAACNQWDMGVIKDLNGFLDLCQKLVSIKESKDGSQD